VTYLAFDYRIGKYPVTVAQFRRFVEEGEGLRKRETLDPGGLGLAEEREHHRAPPVGRPAVDGRQPPGHRRVSWYEAVAYCAWLRAETGRFFRLPDEAMWEKAARGTTAAAGRGATSGTRRN
jgi:formylglycine-generating enzyme required for sulfatase activity